MSSKSKIWDWFYPRKNVLFWKKGQKVKGKWGKKQNNFSLWNFLPQIFTPIHIRQMRHLSFYRTSTHNTTIPLYSAFNSSGFFFSKSLTQEVSLECGVMDGAISHCRLWLMACNSLFDDTILPFLFWMVNTKSYLRNCIQIKKQLYLYSLMPIKQKSKRHSCAYISMRTSTKHTFIFSVFLSSSIKVSSYRKQSSFKPTTGQNAKNDSTCCNKFSPSFSNVLKENVWHAYGRTYCRYSLS